jgi:hypothetical protein
VISPKRYQLLFTVDKSEQKRIYNEICCRDPDWWASQLSVSSCQACNGYYGPCFGEPVCATCHAFLYASHLEQVRPEYTRIVKFMQAESSGSGSARRILHFTFKLDRNRQRTLMQYRYAWNLDTYTCIFKNHLYSYQYIH